MSTLLLCSRSLSDSSPVNEMTLVRSFLALSKVVLQNFNMEGISPYTNHLCASTQSAQTSSVTGVFDVDISTYPSNFISTSEGEDIPYILMLMSTLHLLAKGSWTYHDLLPNRLRINRKLQG